MTTTVLTTNIGKVENKIPNTSGLVTTIVPNTKIENKTPDVSGLVKKTDYNAKILGIYKKIFSCF